MSKPLITPLEPRLLYSAAPADIPYVNPTQVTGVVFSDTVSKNNQPDPGEGLPGCVVTFNNNATHNVVTPVTAADGSFSALVPPGTYDLSIDGPNVTSPFHDASFVVGSDPMNVAFKLGTDPSPTPDPTPNPKPTPRTDLSVTVTKIPSAFSTDKKASAGAITIANKGAAFNGNVNITVYVSRNKTIDSTDFHLPAASIPVKVAAKSTKTIPFDASALAGLVPGGSYYILVDAQVDGDANAANNTAASKSTTKVVTPTLNLTPSFAAQPKLASDKSLHFKLKVKNTGNTAANGPASLVLTAQPTKGGPVIPLGSVGPFTLKINPNKTTPALNETISAASLPAGSYKLVLTLSATLSTAESKTSDNTITSAPFTVK